MALPKHSRIVHKKDFAKVLKGRISVGNGFLQLKVIPSKQPLHRCSVIVPKKVLKKAHDRNRIKRRVIAIVHQNLLLPESQEYTADILIFVRNKELSKQSAIDLNQQVITLLNQAKSRLANFTLYKS